MRRILLALALVLGLLCVCRWQARCERNGSNGPMDAARAAGWNMLEGAPAQKHYSTWNGLEVNPKMAKCSIATGTYGGSVDFVFKVWNGADEAFAHMYAYIGDVDASILSAGPMPDNAGLRFALQIRMAGQWPPCVDSKIVDCPYPEPGQLAEYRYTLAFTETGTNLHATSGDAPIGDKAPTHAKEKTITEEWVADETSSMTVTFDGLEIVAPTTSGLQMLLGPVSVDPDEWTPYGKYMVAFENPKFCGVTCDLSALTARNFGGVEDLWVEGTADGTLGLWGASHALTYHDFGGATVKAPLSYDFSGMRICWMDGREVPDALMLYVTGIRTLNEAGEDIGPLHISYGDLKAMGRYTQKYGLNTWV